ncbi:hypothetical protein NDU88_000565 [Pleurodeles waltl]|uniref:Uncharacterized protein n=1 Tax=Pleurodeles waltl TaxID=8319 RepID=A0AAV7LV23_PLEWA|nr:hypothetical protein NDU88_000565 [Pleurodeles waltl]
MKGRLSCSSAETADLRVSVIQSAVTDRSASCPIDRSAEQRRDRARNPRGYWLAMELRSLRCRAWSGTGLVATTRAVISAHLSHQVHCTDAVAVSLAHKDHPVCSRVSGGMYA